MGLGVLTVTTDATRTRTVATAERETGRLKTFSAVCLSVGPEPNQIWARLSLAQGGTGIANITAVLAQGYVGLGTAISWTGDIPMGGGHSLMLEAWGSAIGIIRATSLTEQT